MIHPAPTNAIDPLIARGVLAEIHPATPTTPAHIVLEVANSNYRIHLVPKGAVTAEVGKRLMGTIRAQARRVDVVDTGGKYLEPVYGRPRRIQGRVLASGYSDADRVVVVDAGVPVHCTLLDARQRPSDFAIGALVSFDAMDGATIEQAR